MPRATAFCVVEGQTENAVLKTLIAPHLSNFGVDIHFPIVRVGRGRGGVLFLTAENLFDQLRRFLCDRRDPFVTTMFDYYAFPENGSKGWDFVANVKRAPSAQPPERCAAIIEQEIRDRTLNGTDIRDGHQRLIPYIQMYELEALFFSESDKMAETFGNPSWAGIFDGVVQSCGGCEKINDKPQTAPSKRIQTVFNGYIKGRSDLAHGPRLAAKLDLATVRKKCPRFDAWLEKLEALTPN